MKIVFLSNYFNHHQKPFSDEMFLLLGENYFFIETVPMEESRISLGWQMDEKPSYVYQSYRNSSFCEQLINDADIVISGSAPEIMLSTRKKNNKIIVRYSERPLKKELNFFSFVRKFIGLHRCNPSHKRIYMLCASAYTALDYQKFRMFKNRTYRWGYFPQKKIYEDLEKIRNLKEPGSILWVARFVDWKHPEIAVALAKKLKESGVSFRMKMIGCGELMSATKMLISYNNLEDCVVVLDSMSPENVRRYMEESSVFISTSDRNEGWGAVVNESMNSCCSVVVNKLVGAAPFLIKNGENGFLYDSFEDLFNKVSLLLTNEKFRWEIAKKAYYTIFNDWNPQEAAIRCVQLCETLMYNGSCDLFVDGPCSRC